MPPLLHFVGETLREDGRPRRDGGRDTPINWDYPSNTLVVVKRGFIYYSSLKYKMRDYSPSFYVCSIFWSYQKCVWQNTS